LFFAPDPGKRGEPKKGGREKVRGAEAALRPRDRNRAPGRKEKKEA